MMRVLKKYANRRLYDTETSSYIKLEDVQKLIMQFQSVQVIDIATGEDITEQILLSVISNIEGQKSQQKVLTRSLLEQLIRMYSYDYTSAAPVSQFLENALRFYQDSAKQMTSPMNMWGNMMGSYDLWQKTFGMGMGQSDDSPATSDSVGDGVDLSQDTQPNQPDSTNSANIAKPSKPAGNNQRDDNT